jgi:hypothetical protein
VREPGDLRPAPGKPSPGLHREGRRP